MALTVPPSEYRAEAAQHHGTGKNGEQYGRDLILGSQPKGSDQFKADITDPNNAQLR